MSGVLERMEAKVDALVDEVKVLRGKVEAMNPEDELWGVEKITEETGNHINTVRRMCREGRYQTAKLYGREWRVRKSEVLNLKSK